MLIYSLFFCITEHIMNLKFARALRKNSTPAEIKLWHQLRNRNFYNLKFKRQYTFGNYIVDFICLAEKLIIELDGSQHMEQIVYDEKRTAFLHVHGFKVLRIWNNELSDIDAVLNKIYYELSLNNPQRFASIEKLYE